MNRKKFILIVVGALALLDIAFNVFDVRFTMKGPPVAKDVSKVFEQDIVDEAKSLFEDSYPDCNIVEYNEQSKQLIICFWPEDADLLAVYAYIGEDDARDTWDELGGSMESVGAALQKRFATSGYYNADVSILCLNPSDHEKVLIRVSNGRKMYDAVENRDLEAMITEAMIAKTPLGEYLASLQDNNSDGD